MTFNEKLINLRKMRGLSQTDLALAIGVSRQAVYKWESGQSYPEAAKLIELKVFFNISIDDMRDDSFDVVLPAKKKRKRLSRSRYLYRGMLRPPKARCPKKTSLICRKKM